ncbi:zf-HC2 domain-containing protein [Plantactinospora endophytica]|uniref:Membrane protein n=1 Tax=Plantactinospora endophytica TaxID=673535 RepID=A0ABQ4EAH1_9ACTN|nr:zf-HC2 domain-containing protein [Plantactinospora endophytica]GIG91262.1 membrane protein [Plantactinospora endophytica]
MGCEQYREALSARLDGEEHPAERAGVDRHLAGCADCRGWLESATALNRLARTSVVPPPMEIDDELLAVAPGPGRARLAGTLRIALGVVGVAQFLLGAAQIAGIGSTNHPHGLEVVLGGGPDHLWHESAAWNVALGAGFAWIALRRTRPLGLLPTLTAFVAVLTLLSVNDAIAGRVDPNRILSHGLILAGYVIIIGLSRPTFESGDPPTRHGERSGPGWRVRFEEEPAPAPPRLRLVRARPNTAQARTDRRAA